MNLNQFLEKFIETITAYNSYIKEGDYRSFWKSCNSELKNLLIPLHINFNSEPPNVQDGRFRFVIFSSMNADHRIPLVRSANGIVYSVEPENNIKIQQLTFPPENTNPKYSNLDIEHYIQDNEYEIYPVLDASMICVYYWYGWHISTRRAYRVNDLYWRGLTYEQAIKEIDPEIFEKLDKKINNNISNSSYCFAMHHKNFQPFQSFQDNKLILFSPEDPDFENYKPITDPFQDKSKKYFVQHLNNKCKTAHINYYSNGEVVFGYVLRSKNPEKTQEFSNIIMESDLFQIIKNLVYNCPRNKNTEIQKSIQNKFKETNYMVLRNWLHYTNSDIFFRLFPQFNSVYKKLNNIHISLAKAIYNKHELTDPVYKKFNNLVQKEYKPIRNYDVLCNLLKNMKFIDLYMELLNQ